MAEEIESRTFAHEKFLNKQIGIYEADSVFIFVGWDGADARVGAGTESAECDR